jgi:two-component system, chemotaxis family, response regulator Rcp1
MNITPINILLVEDNEGDILLTTEALEEGEIPKSLKVIRDGSSMLIYLKEIAEKSPSELPDLILLDINLPKKNGHEVLKEVKNNKLLQHIPIIMLTTSSSEMDILKSYQEHANCYLIKPMEIGDFVQLVSKIEEFWLSLVKLPKMV